MPKRGTDYFRYIPVRQRDVQWGLYVIGAGRTLPEYQVAYYDETLRFCAGSQP